jgi:hypothetical protein
MIVQACRKGVRICTEDHRADAAVSESVYDLEEMLLASSVAYRVRNEQYRSTLRTPDALTWHNSPRHSSTEVDDSAGQRGTEDLQLLYRDVSRTASCLLGSYGNNLVGSVWLAYSFRER